MFANHDNNVKKPVQIIILGSGFAGVEVLKKLQKEFRNNDSIVITSKDNYLLFTPMLPEVATGTVETRHIIAPVRSFCKNASFHEATVQLIDLKNKRIVVMHEIGRNNLSSDIRQHVLFYDHLVIALGSENNFFGVNEIKKNTLKMKSIANKKSGMRTRYSTKNHNQRLSRSPGISRGLCTWGLCFNNRSSYRKTISADCTTCNKGRKSIGTQHNFCDQRTRE